MKRIIPSLSLIIVITRSALATPYVPPERITTHYGETLFTAPQVDATYNHYFEFLQLSQFLQPLQVQDPGVNFGGEREEEIGGMWTIIETDNTLESIWVWSRYYELTGNSQYNDEIADAWIYAYQFPAWLEGAGYYSAHNCAWGLTAEMRYREVYGDSAHWNYGVNCANYIMTTQLPFTSDLNVMVTGWCIGNLYLYGEAAGNTAYMEEAVRRGRQIMDWVEASPASRLALESWAMSSGTFVWGICNSVFREDPVLGQQWLSTYGPMVQVYEPAAGGWSNAWNVAYCNAQGGMYEVTGEEYYGDNHLWLTNYLLSKDIDNDGGIPASASGSSNADASWTSAYLAKMGCNVYCGNNVDAGVMLIRSPADHTGINAGTPVTIEVIVGNWGLDNITNAAVILEGAYEDTVTVNISSGGFFRTVVTGWTPTALGIDSLRVSIEAAGDENPFNDTDISYFMVRQADLPDKAELFAARILIDSSEEIDRIRSLGARILQDELPGKADVLASEEVLERLISAEYEVENVVPAELTGLDEIDEEYHTYEEYTAALQQYAADYPGLCKVDSIGRGQQFPRTVWSVKVSDNVSAEEDEIAVLYVGVHHACEVMGGETLLYMIGHLLEEYGSDPEITSWVDNYEIFFVPLMNPDGNYAVTEGIDYFWRKNARDIDQDSVYYEFFGGTWWSDDTEGIDLNRNYDWYWSSGGAGNPWNYYYRGESPFSEAETQAVRDLAQQQHFVSAISFHSYGEVVIYPWVLFSQNAPDNDIIEAMSLEMADCFIADNGGNYDISNGYGDQGQFRNWLYGVTGGLGFCVEVLPYPMFIPPGGELAIRTERLYAGAKYLLQRAGGGGITGHITDALTGQPLYARVEISDRISSMVEPRYNEPLFGRYTRLLVPGTYGIDVEAEGYEPTVQAAIVTADTMTVLDIALTPVNAVGSPEAVEDYEFGLNCSPNPFNQRLALEFTLPEAGEIKLAVYDVLGREVEALGAGSWGLGKHTVMWDAGEAGSGVYFVRLSVDGGQSSVRKVVLMK